MQCTGSFSSPGSSCGFVVGASVIFGVLASAHIRLLSKQMASTSKIAADYGFGARAPWAAARASDHNMKERVRLSGLFPQVNNEPLTTTLTLLVEEFKKNAALGAILKRRRALEGQAQDVMQGGFGRPPPGGGNPPGAPPPRSPRPRGARNAPPSPGDPMDE